MADVVIPTFATAFLIRTLPEGEEFIRSYLYPAPSLDEALAMFRVDYPLVDVREIRRSDIYWPPTAEQATHGHYDA